ncbi:MAG TPA: alpha/beta fold hydrolase [Candidatus Microsaccharimonas sp.]|jgi:pimeloyl-ACP methyl ester carboxylesterase
MLDTLIHKYLRLPYRLNVHTDQKTKSPRATVLLLHGIGNSGAIWDMVVDQLPNDLRIVSMDLLGFGRSPKPEWLQYNVEVQARSVIATLAGLGIRQPLIIVGHSLGSLTAVEIAKLSPRMVKSLILCSPPLYSNEISKKLMIDQTKILKQFYRIILKNSHRIIKAAPVGTKFNLVGKIFNINSHNANAYMGALESSIMEQTSLEDIVKIKKPIHMIHGSFDPVVIKKNLTKVLRANDQATLSVVRAGHEMVGAYIPVVVRAVIQDAE